MDKMYFDYAATTPVDPAVIEAMTPYWHEEFGNAASPHDLGRAALKALEDARTNLADFLGALPEEIVLTSGATESNNHAIYGAAHALRGIGKHVIVSAIEHHSVLEPAEFLQAEGYKVTFLPVDREGRVSPTSVGAAITDQTILVAVMHASNEIGTIQPIREISALTRAKKIPLLVDACQTVGHIPVDVNELGADLLSLSAHKFYGPKGVGALYVRKKTPLEKLLRGGDQERDMRASTQNVPGAVGMSKAVALARERMTDEAARQTQWREQLFEEVPRRVEGVTINGHRGNRLPNNVHFSFERVEGESLLMALDMNKVYASMGSACTSGAMEPSHVLRAIGLDDELAYGSLRLSLGRWTTQEHVDTVLDKLPGLVTSLRI
ncbi:MAG: cysteine desulfurase [Candidatus Omnitrophica bacterium]|nr:cysteine desulfurase [Candidatus Omnitrophota bacterium]